MNVFKRMEPRYTFEGLDRTDLRTIREALLARIEYLANGTEDPVMAERIRTCGVSVTLLKAIDGVLATELGE